MMTNRTEQVIDHLQAAPQAQRHCLDASVDALPGQLLGAPAIQPDPSLPATRRQLFTTGILAAAAAASSLATARKAEAQGGGIHNPTSDWLSPELRLARRITMGLNAEEIARATTMGYDAYLEYQLDHLAIDDSAVETWVAANYPAVWMSELELFGKDVSPVDQLRQATIYRAIYSRRQLFQRMCELWTDHFNMYIIATFSQVRPVDYRTVTRAHALGKYPDLLRASAHSAAMLTYSLNAKSVYPTPNQSYGRIILELHSLGGSGGYTQADVDDVARCFTGWTVRSAGPDRGKFYFDASRHDNGPKTVLGVPIPANGGQADGETVLDILTSHPSTARNIAGRIARWLLRYDPPASLISDAAASYMSTGGDIRSMIRIILQKPNLMAAPAKLKRPHHLMVSAMRATDAVAHKRGMLMLAQRSPGVGHELFKWIAPSGYPDRVGYWAPALVPSIALTTSIARSGMQDVVPNVSPYAGLTTPADMVDRIDDRIFGGEMSAGTRNYILKQMTRGKTIYDALMLAVGSPDFVWY